MDKEAVRVMGSSHYTLVKIFLNSIHGFGLVTFGKGGEVGRKQSPTQTIFVLLHCIPSPDLFIGKLIESC